MKMKTEEFLNNSFCITFTAENDFETTILKWVKEQFSEIEELRKSKDTNKDTG